MKSIYCSVEVIALVPDVKPLLLAVEARLVLPKVVEVNKAMGAITLGAPVIAIQLATTDTLATTFLLPRKLVRLELSSLVRSIAPGLRLAVAASAPEVSLALLHHDLVAALLRHMRQNRRLKVSLVRDVRQIISSAKRTEVHAKGKPLPAHHSEASSQHLINLI